MLKDKFSFLTGVVVSKVFGFLSLADDAVDARDIAFTNLAFWQKGTWGNNGQVNFTVLAVAICTHPLKQMVAIGAHGEAFLAGNGDPHEERVGSGASSPQARGELRSVRSIGGKAYAVGMQRQVYRRDGRLMWTCIDEAIRPRPGEVLGFEAVDGFSESEIYAVGWDGEIWRSASGVWTQVGSPTNLILTDVCCAGDGRVYACGRLGLVVAGRGDTWEALGDLGMSEDIWSLAWFQGALYASTYQGLFRLTGDRLEFVDMGSDLPDTTYRLSASEDALWSIGAKDVMAYDGVNWSRIA